MPAPQPTIYREHALQEHTSPERLDGLLAIVRPPTWLLLGALGIGVALALVWALFGRIPTAVDGTAILLRPKQLVGFQARASGPVRSIEVAVGELVAEGQVLARLHLPWLEQQLDQERAKLAQFEARRGRLAELHRELAREERAFLERQGEMIRRRIDGLSASAERSKAFDEAYVAQQRVHLRETRARVVDVQAKQRELRGSSDRLVEEGVLSRSDGLEAQRRQIESELRLAELQVEASEIDLRESLSLEGYEKRQDLVQELEIELHALALREHELTSALVERELIDATEAGEIERRIDELQTRIESEGTVASEFAGRVIELTVTQGQFASIGQRLGRLELEDAEAELQALAYFPVKDGKRLSVGLPLRISPATAERARFGSMRGVVASVSDYPVTTESAANQIGDPEVARRVLGGESRIEVLVRLERDEGTPSGFAWTNGQGPEGLAVTAGTSARVRATIEERAPISLLLPFLGALRGSE